MKRSTHRWVPVLASLVVCARATVAFAAPRDDDHAAAVQSFQRGTLLVEKGRIQDAIDAFDDALAHEPSSVGARLNLADCYEKLGAPAQAWRQYALAASYAARAGDDRVGMARASAEHLEPRLLRVTLRFEPPDAPGLAVRVDGEAVEPALVAGGAIAVTPGRHRLEATAPEKKESVEDVEGRAGDAREVRFALLAEDRPVAPRPAPPPAAPDASRSSQRTWALVAGGVGLAGIAAGSALGLVASSKKSTLERESSDPSVGATRFDSELSDAKSLATLSTVSFVLGGAAVAAGVTLWITSPSERSSPVSVSVSAAPANRAVVVGGAF
jgi:hypothetical protein